MINKTLLGDKLSTIAILQGEGSLAGQLHQLFLYKVGQILPKRVSQYDSTLGWSGGCMLSVIIMFRQNR